MFNVGCEVQYQLWYLKEAMVFDSSYTMRFDSNRVIQQPVIYSAAATLFNMKLRSHKGNLGRSAPSTHLIWRFKGMFWLKGSFNSLTEKFKRWNQLAANDGPELKTNPELDFEKLDCYALGEGHC